jgi:hypothetical protein
MLPYHGGAILARQATDKSPQRNSRFGILFLLEHAPEERTMGAGSIEERARQPGIAVVVNRAPDAQGRRVA